MFCVNFIDLLCFSRPQGILLNVFMLFLKQELGLKPFEPRLLF